MKSLMSYVLTKKEKAAIVVLLLLILLTGWYVGIYSGTDRSSGYHRSGRCNCNGAGKVSKDQIHAG